MGVLNQKCCGGQLKLIERRQMRTGWVLDKRFYLQLVENRLL